MKVLIVEDDRPKLDQLRLYAEERFPSVQVDVAGSYNSGINSILENEYDLLLLDMALQTFDVAVQGRGGRVRKFGGREILAQMKRRGIDTKTIVVTQLDTFGEAESLLTLEELREQLRGLFPEIYLGTIYYNSALDNWKNDINQLISINEIDDVAKGE